MEQPTNKKIIISLVILFGVMILAGAIYFFFLRGFSFSDFFGKKAPEKTEVQAPPSQEAPTEPNKNTAVIRERENAEAPTGGNTTEKEVDIRQVNKDDLMRMAASFAERFGSFSNHSNFSNIIDLKIFMSASMEKWADSYVYEQRKKEIDPGIYYGVTTRSITEEVKEFDDDTGEATIMVETRRRESTGSTNNISNTFEQDILINFVKENNAWKVNRADWQEKLIN